MVNYRKVRHSKIYNLYPNYEGHSKSSKKELEKQDTFPCFSIWLQAPFNALGPTMLKHRNPIREEGYALVLQKLLDCTYDLIVVSKIASTQVGLEFREQEEVRWS